jgi:tRNA(Ile)-lysidine synthase
LRVASFENNVFSALESCPEGAVFLAAVSGGADSMAMLAALAALVPKERLFCLHVDHALRPADESAGDAEHVRSFCEKNGIDCTVVSIPPGRVASYAKKHGTGIEAAARFFRRKALFRRARELGKDARILTAHTKDDMLETSLMRVLRGAGPAGLAAMPARRGRILRPLLNCSRAEVLAYLKEKNINWREDSTNRDEVFLRNRIRGKLIPLLNECFPSWKSGVIGMAQTQSLAASFLAEEAKRLVSWSSSTPHSPLPTPYLTTDAANFFAQPPIIREEAIFCGLNIFPQKSSHGDTETRRRFKSSEAQNLNSSSVPPVPPCPRVRSFNRKVIRRFCSGAVKSVDLGTLRISQKDGKIVISLPRKSPRETGFSLLIKEPGFYNLNSISISVRPFDGSREGGFPAALPLAFRPGFKDDFLVCKGRKIKKRDLAAGKTISAVDILGAAAFIDNTGVLFERDLPEKETELYLIEIGGTDVK